LDQLSVLNLHLPLRNLQLKQTNTRAVVEAQIETENLEMFEIKIKLLNLKSRHLWSALCLQASNCSTCQDRNLKFLSWDLLSTIPEHFWSDYSISPI